MAKSIPYEKLESYIKGDLKGEELQAFEDLIKTNEDANKELSLYRDIRAAQNDKGLTALEDALGKAEENYFEADKKETTITQKKNGSIIWFKRLAAAVFIGLCLYFGNQFINNTSPIDANALYAEFAQHDFSLQEMSAENELGEIQQLLKSGAYQSALPVIDNYLDAHPITADVLLVRGIASLEINQFEEAEATFKLLIADFALYQNEAKWYLALTYLKQNKGAKSKSTLSEIPKQSSRYEDAQTLKARLQ